MLLIGQSTLADIYLKARPSGIHFQFWTFVYIISYFVCVKVSQLILVYNQDHLAFILGSELLCVIVFQSVTSLNLTNLYINCPRTTLSVGRKIVVQD